MKRAANVCGCVVLLLTKKNLWSPIINAEMQTKENVNNYNTPFENRPFSRSRRHISSSVLIGQFKSATRAKKPVCWRECPLQALISQLLKGTLSRWQNLKKSGWLFQVRILSSWWYHNDRTFFQLHYTGIIIFIKPGPVFVGCRCCKMCFWNLEFLRRCSWQSPFKLGT